MFRFFRQIRQSLIMNNKTSKYLKYAIGEILLVVIGILFALQINTWNQNRQDRIHEQQILKQLLTEYTNNLNQLNQKIDIRNGVLFSCLKILSYRTTEREYVDKDSFDLHLSRVITRPTFDPELGITNELTSSGKLYLITSSNLRNEIMSIPSLFLGELQEEEQVTFNHVENIFLPFLIENYQVGPVISQFLNDETFRAKFTIGETSFNKSFTDLLVPSNFEIVLDHPDLEDHVTLMFSNTTYTNEQSEGVKNKIEEIIALIEQEIEN